LGDDNTKHTILAGVSNSLKSDAREQGPRVGEKTGQSAGGASFAPISDGGLRTTVVHRNLCAAELYEHALSKETKWGSYITASGALATLSGAKTGRSPKDKRVVREPMTEGDLWWGEGSPLFEMDERGVKIRVKYTNFESFTA
jgi:phosphoenolpyruvate carboxykinase (ATP)